VFFTVNVVPEATVSDAGVNWLPSNVMVFAVVSVVAVFELCDEVLVLVVPVLLGVLKIIYPPTPKTTITTRPIINAFMFSSYS